MKFNITKLIGSSLLVCATALIATSCDQWIDNANTPKNTLRPDEINTPSMIALVTITEEQGVVKSIGIKDGPLVANLKTLAGEATAEVNLALGALVDELSSTARPNILLYRELKQDNVQISTNSSSRVWERVQNLRARAQEILDIEQELAIGDARKLPVIKAYGRYVGHLYLGYAYDLLANTFSKDLKEAQGVRINNKIVSHAELKAEALHHYEEAIKVAESTDFKKLTEGSIKSDIAIRQVYGLIIKHKLHNSQYSEIATLWDKAYKAQESLSIIYNEQGKSNGIYDVIGTQNVREAQIDPEFRSSLRNAAEKKMIAVSSNRDGFLYLTSIQRYSPIVLVDDNELSLIKAEMILRGHMQGDALNEVNKVISLYDASSQETVQPTLETLSHIRRVYLALRGERAMDFRRGFITNSNKKTAWEARRVHYLPMPELEYIQ